MTDASLLTPLAIAAMELFLDLPPAAIEEVAASARLRRLTRETRIFDQGDPADRAYALLDGGVRITQSGGDGGQVVVRLIGPGEMFGTVALFTDHRYPAEAVTIGGAVVISWSETQLLALIRRHPQIAMNVIRIVGRRLKEVQERVRELSTQRVERRVAHTLLRLAVQAGHSTADGTAIEFPLRRKDVADIAGTTLHTASRILTAWEKAGLLASHGQRLTIRKPSGIQRIADGLSL